MIVSCALPLLAIACFGLAAPQLARRVRPLIAVWLLSLGALLMAALGVVAVAIVAMTGLGRLAPAARFGHWSPRIVGLESPFPVWSADLSYGLLTLAVLGGARAAWQHGRRLGAAWHSTAAAPAGLLVLPDDDPYAYAVPGWPGRIVTSRGLLRRLDGPGRRAVIAHEQAHLDARHDLHLAAAVLAAGLNPLLARLPAAVELACERRADELAAEAVGDRRTVARAIVSAVHPHLETLAWAASGSEVPLRVRQLLRPASYRRRIDSLLLLTITVLGLVLSVLSVLWLVHDLHRVFEAAGA